MRLQVYVVESAAKGSGFSHDRLLPITNSENESSVRRLSFAKFHVLIPQVVSTFFLWRSCPSRQALVGPPSQTTHTAKAGCPVKRSPWRTCRNRNRPSLSTTPLLFNRPEGARPSIRTPRGVGLQIRSPGVNSMSRSLGICRKFDSYHCRADDAVSLLAP